MRTNILAGGHLPAQTTVRNFLVAIFRYESEKSADLSYDATWRPLDITQGMPSPEQGPVSRTPQYFSRINARVGTVIHQYFAVNNRVTDPLGALGKSRCAFGKVRYFLRRRQINFRRIENKQVGCQAAAQQAAIVNAEDRCR